MAATTTGQAQLNHRQVVVIVCGIMIGMLLAALDQTIVSTALPTIVGELGGLEHLSWVITAYLLTSTTSVPIYGKLSDIYGRKLLFQLAIVVFLIGSLLAGFSQSMMQLIAFRALQGLGAGGLISMAMAIIGDVVSPRERGRYQGYMGAVFAVASVAGPLLGGLFVDRLSWRWVFIVNIPVGLLALAVTTVVLRLPFRRAEHPIDYLGAALMVGGVSCLLLITTWGGNEYAWTSPMILGLTVAAVVLIGLFIVQETRAEEPLLPLRLFADRIFTVSSMIGLVVGLAMFGALAFMPVYLQVVKGASATSSGLRLTPLMIGIIGASVLSGKLISDTGRYRIYPIAGTATMTVALFLLSRIGVGTNMVVVSAYMFLLGIGIGQVMQVIILATQNSVDYRDLGTATAGVTFFRSMGGAFGVALFGSILNNRLNYHLPRLVPEAAQHGVSSSALTGAPDQLHALPPDVLHGVVEAFSLSLDTVFFWAVPVGVVAFAFSWLLQEKTLRESAHVGVMEEAPIAPAEVAPSPVETEIEPLPLPVAEEPLAGMEPVEGG